MYASPKQQKSLLRSLRIASSQSSLNLSEFCQQRSQEIAQDYLDLKGINDPALEQEIALEIQEKLTTSLRWF